MLNLKWDVSVKDYFKDLQIMTVFGTVFTVYFNETAGL